MVGRFETLTVIERKYNEVIGNVLEELRGIRSELGHITERLAGLEAQAKEREKIMDTYHQDLISFEKRLGKAENRVSCLEHLPDRVRILEGFDRSDLGRTMAFEGSVKMYLKLVGIPVVGSVVGSVGAVVFLMRLGIFG